MSFNELHFIAFMIIFLFGVVLLAASLAHVSHKN